MIKAQNKTSDYAQKISLYSGHDKNLISLLQSLRIYDFHFPEFSSALIFELLSQNEKYFVKVNGSDKSINKQLVWNAYSKKHFPFTDSVLHWNTEGN